VNGAGGSEDVSMGRMDRGRNNYDDVNIAPSDENGDASENFNTSKNQEPVNYVPGHPLNTLHMNPVINIAQNRASVHFVPGHSYHPLRMNPVDAMGTIRPVAPDMEGSKVPTFEAREQVLDSSKSSVPLISAPLQLINSRSQAETMENSEHIPSSHGSTPLISERLSPAVCDC
jgi:hypothetical protein